MFFPVVTTDRMMRPETVLTFSPPSKSRGREARPTPRVLLMPCTKEVVLDFGHVEPGTCASQDLVLQNPTSRPQNVVIGKRLDETTGLRTNGVLPLVLLPGESEPLTVQWQPSKEGKLEAALTLATTDVRLGPWVHSIKVSVVGNCRKKNYAYGRHRSPSCLPPQLAPSLL